MHFIRASSLCAILAAVLTSITFSVEYITTTPFAYGSVPSDNLTATSGCKDAHYLLPVNDFEMPKVSKLMDINITKYSAGHRGVDFNVVDSQAIIAPFDGEITYKGVAFGVPTITFTIKGVKNTFQPAKTELKKGTKIRQGEQIGVVTLGDYGDHSTVLHWGMSETEDEYLNPLAFVYRKRIVLEH